MRQAPAPAKINLALVVGPLRPDGKHEVATVLQKIELADRVELEPSAELEVAGFRGDTLVRDALVALADAAGVEANWRIRLDKRIPVAAGLGGGSSDAAAALRLANDLLPRPLAHDELARVAGVIGVDVPFFLADGPRLGTGDGTRLEPIDPPQDYVVLLLLPAGTAKTSTAAVYEAFDRRGGAAGFDQRRAALLDAVRRNDLSALPQNDLARSPLADDLREHGATRADVTGAGPVVYGLFADAEAAAGAAERLGDSGRTWVTKPAW